ncbi:MAG: TonB-dependent receptor [Methylococcaceae bacterium]|nr:TonB-dependent receptor [Methylococcaceae bacterium]
MTIQLRRLAAGAPLLFTASLQATEIPTPLEPVVITATRTEQPLDKTLAATTVIDRAEIEKRQAQSVQDLLRGVPGISISTNGGLGKVSDILIRGTEPGHTLVLIDGIRAGSATTGSQAIQDLPVDQIDHIEIVRGPRSSLYGSEALGGVIHIFTRKGGKGLKPYVSVGAGSHSAYRVAGGVSGGDDKAWYNLSGARLETRGFNTCRGRPFELGGGGCYTVEPDPDGYRNDSGSARLGYRFDNGLQLEGNLLHAEGHNKFDGSVLAGNHGPFVQQALGGNARYSPFAFWDMSLRAGRTLDESTQYWNRQYVSRFNTQRVSATWQNDFHLAEGHLLSAGLDFYNDQVNSSVEYSVKSRNNKAGFLQYQLSLGGFDAVLGTRVDDNEQFGVHTTGNVALGYTWENGMRLSGSWGNAFRAPTFNQLYYPNYGTPTLKPETSESWEAGLSGKHFGVSWAVNGYYTEIGNLISSTFDSSLCPAPFYFCAQNVNQAEILGVEATASTRLLGFDLAATFTASDPRDPLTDTVLFRRSQVQFRFDVDRSVGPVRAGATVYGEDRRFDDPANQNRLPGFVTVDLRLATEPYRGLSLEGRLANLLDQHYETARFFQQDGRNFFITLRYAPDI